MPKLSRVTKVEVRFLFLVLVFDFNLTEFSAVILEKGLLLNDNVGSSVYISIVCTKKNNKNTKRKGGRKSTRLKCCGVFKIFGS